MKSGNGFTSARPQQATHQRINRLKVETLGRLSDHNRLPTRG